MAELAAVEKNVRLGREVLGEFIVSGARAEIVRWRFVGPPAEHDPIRLGLFAGVHGDEPAGCAALARFATTLTANPVLVRGYELDFYPVVNPLGLARGTRVNAAGLDLNREFWCGSAQAEVCLLEAALSARQYHGIVALHSDDTCDGLYGYAHGRELNEALLKPALAAAERVLPRDARAQIDGFAAIDGLIHECFTGVLSAPPTQRPQPFDLIFETPALAPFESQVQAFELALATIVASHRSFIAYAQDL